MAKKPTVKETEVTEVTSEVTPDTPMISDRTKAEMAYGRELIAQRAAALAEQEAAEPEAAEPEAEEE